MPNLFPISLGCPKNLTDTETMLGLLQKNGHAIVFKEEDAEVALLNTCAFIKPAVQESVKELKRLLHLKKTGRLRKVIVAGCLVQREKEKLLREFPEIDAIVGVGSIQDILQALESPEQVYLNPLNTVLAVPRDKFQATLPHTAYLKIADGCDNRCAYCLIPALRGGYRSRPINDIIEEAQNLVAKGVRELSLVAQDTTSYGIDLYQEYRLVDLLQRLTKLNGLEWIRIMYAYPEKVTDELLYLLAGEPKICNYLDLPLQHIADSVLKSMRRQSTEKLIRAKIDRIRTLVPGIAIRTNFIVGYPGETAADFEILKSFVKEVSFNRVGIFTYWREQGTPAADMPGQVSAKIRQERYDELIELQSRVIDKMNKTKIGKIFRVLLDSAFQGRTAEDAPEIDGAVIIENDQPLTPGTFLQARITQAEGYTLKGAPAT